MNLSGTKKKYLRDVILYYMKSTQQTYDGYLATIGRTLGETEKGMPYADWLAGKCFQLLQAADIGLLCCMENKEAILKMIASDESNNAASTPELWRKKALEMVRELVGERWGTCYIWDACCGETPLTTGLEYPADKLILSTLDRDDANKVKAMNPEAEVFQLDFLNGIDYDKTNLHFSGNLPEKVKAVLGGNEEIIFLMNPPSGTDKKSDMYTLMQAHGVSKRASTLYYQFLYRVTQLKQVYGLKHVHIATFGPIDMHLSVDFEEFLRDFGAQFTFRDGFLFSSPDNAVFNNTDGNVCFSVWSGVSFPAESNVLVRKMAVVADGQIQETGKQLLRLPSLSLYEWCKPNLAWLEDVTGRTDSDYIPTPVAGNGYTLKGMAEKEQHELALGFLKTSNIPIKEARQVLATSAWCEGVTIFDENLLRCAASYAARSCYNHAPNPYDSCIVFEAPDESIEGYQTWAADALVLMLFDTGSNFMAYRDTPCGEFFWTAANCMFPISKDVVQSVVTDPTIIEDMGKFNKENHVLVRRLNEQQAHLSPAGMGLYKFGLEAILTSLQGDMRKEAGYPCGLMAWDAGFAQIRQLKSLFTAEKEKQYTYLLAQLKDSMYAGLTAYGFLSSNIK